MTAPTGAPDAAAAVDAAGAAVATALRSAAALLGELDGRAGDGDLGLTAGTIADVLDTPTGAVEAAPALRAWAGAVAERAPSTSGTLLATGLLRAARAVAGAAPDPAPDPGQGSGAAAIARALRAAGEGIAERGRAQAGEKTMLDALLPAAYAAEEAAGRSAPVAEALTAAAAAADLGATATAGMTPRHGRAGWLAERSQGHEDAGARLVATALGGLAGWAASSAAG